jgi:hypothetical protein
MILLPLWIRHINEFLESNRIRTRCMESKILIGGQYDFQTFFYRRKGRTRMQVRNCYSETRIIFSCRTDEIPNQCHPISVYRLNFESQLTGNSSVRFMKTPSFMTICDSMLRYNTNSHSARIYHSVCNDFYQCSGSVHFGTDPDPQIRTFDQRIRILLFSSVTYKTTAKNSFVL